MSPVETSVALETTASEANKVKKYLPFQDESTSATVNGLVDEYVNGDEYYYILA